MIIRVSLLLLPFLLAACAGPEGSAPSLSPRPIEGVLDAPVRAIAPVQSTSDSALATEIDALVGQAETAHSAFTARYPAAQEAVVAASGSAIESEAWIKAQLAVSALDSVRSETVRALGSLDGLLAGQAVTGAPSETEKLLEARERVTTLYAAQNDQYDPLNAALRTR